MANLLLLNAEPIAHTNGCLFRSAFLDGHKNIFYVKPVKLLVNACVSRGHVSMESLLCHDFFFVFKAYVKSVS